MKIESCEENISKGWWRPHDWIRLRGQERLPCPVCTAKQTGARVWRVIAWEPPRPLTFARENVPPGETVARIQEFTSSTLMVPGPLRAPLAAWRYPTNFPNPEVP